MACGYMSDGDVMVRGGGSGRAAVSRAADRLMSGYTSEGGGGVTSYARRMQQRFLEGILAVRQSMERTPQFTDDDRSVAFNSYIVNGDKRDPERTQSSITFFLVIAPWDKLMTFLRNGLAVQNWKMDIDDPTSCGVA